MTTDDDRYAQGADMLLRKTRQMSLVLLALTSGYGITAAIIVHLIGVSGLALLIVTTTAVMNVWVNKRVIVEIPKYRSMLADSRLAGSHGVLGTIIMLDALSLAVSIGAAGWLVMRLTTTMAG